MLFDRRPFYWAGLVLGIGIVTFILVGPKTSPEQRVARDVAILAREPWDSVRVLDIQFEGAPAQPSDVLVRGARPNGTPVLVHFAADSPYTARTAVERLRGEDLDHVAEILMVPRSLVLPEFRERFRRDATHAGIAYFAGPPPVPTAEAALDEESPPGAATADPAAHDG
jgi:hypothetical protein